MALVTGDVPEAPALLGRHGVDVVRTVTGDAFGRYLLEPRRPPRSPRPCDADSPRVLLMAGTVLGKEFGACVAARQGWP